MLERSSRMVTRERAWEWPLVLTWSPRKRKPALHLCLCYQWLSGLRQWPSALPFLWDDTLSSFPIATLTNYHQLDGWKQPKCIVSQFQRPEAWNQGVGRAMPLWRLVGRIHCGLLISASGGRTSLGLCLHHSSPWLYGHIASCSFLCHPPLPPLIRTPIIGFRVHPDHPG